MTVRKLRRAKGKRRDARIGGRRCSTRGSDECAAADASLPGRSADTDRHELTQGRGAAAACVAPRLDTRTAQAQVSLPTHKDPLVLGIAWPAEQLSLKWGGKEAIQGGETPRR